MAKRRRLIPAAPFGQPAEGSPGAPETVIPVSPPGGEDQPALRPAPVLSPTPVQRPAMVPPIARVAAEASAHAALDEVSGAMTRARSEGRLVLSLDLAALEEGYLVRDRLGVEEEEMQGLTASIRAHGQRNPVEVVDLGAGRYGLISGWRRLQALRRLAAEGETRPVLALLRRPENASEAYVAMVEENEIRQGLSYYERARIAARAVDLGVFETERQALQRLFAHSSRPRRSKIGSFLGLYRALDGVLAFPSAIPERLGLALEKALAEAPERVAELRAELSEAALSGAVATAGAEMALLQGFVAGKSGAARAGQTRMAQAGAKGADQRGRNPDRRTGPSTGFSMGEAPHDRPATGFATAPLEIRPGVFLQVMAGSEAPGVQLSGPGVTADLQRALADWLRGWEQG